MVFCFHFCMLGCMRLMCTAIHSSQCLFYYTVSFRCSLILFCQVGCIYNSCISGSFTGHYFVAVVHYFLSPLLLAHGFIPVLLSNLLFMVAVSYYHYLNFLGYDGKISIFHDLVTHENIQAE